jgi:endoglucanase
MHDRTSWPGRRADESVGRQTTQAKCLCHVVTKRFLIKGWCLMLATTVTAGARPVYAQIRARIDPSDAVKVCQVGYLPAESKRAMLTAAPTGDVLLRRSNDDSVAMTLRPSDMQRDVDSGDEIRIVDFSAVREPGWYYLDVPGVGASFVFQIAGDAFAPAFRLTMRSYYGQRCGAAVSLAPDFPQYHYDACHPAPAHFHPSSGKDGEIEMTGGWHDAGDFGRYVVNSGITTGTLLWAYELNSDKVRSTKLDILESGGPLPDVLAEVKWNIDWMLKMQDADGGAWHKATSEKFCGFVMPANDPLPVFVIGSGTPPYKVTTATADLAAVCAIAARVYRPFDAAYADRCLAAAERAWKWLEANPTDHYFDKNPEGVGTGGYGDKNAGDERLWAAAELFRTTDKPVYHDYFLANHASWTITATEAQGWPNVQNMGLYTYALSGRRGAKADVVTKIKRDALAAADGIVTRVNASGYRVPLTSDQYVWGSNGVVANYAMMLRLADRFEHKPDYVDAAQDALHYLLGRNHFNTSFVTHVGQKFAMHPHHRPSAADGVDAPWPGLLVGGPNSHQGRRGEDKKTKTAPPATVWLDDQNDYVTNETAINWNAPLVFILAEALP